MSHNDGHRSKKETRNISKFQIPENAADSVSVTDRTNRIQYDVEVGEKDNRVSIVLESGIALPGPPSFTQLQPLLKFDGPGPEIINGRVAMAAFYGLVITELTSGSSLIQQAATPAGAAAAVALMVATTAASLAPLYTGKATAVNVFPNPTDSYPDRPLPYFFTPLAEQINGRAAMVGLVALAINEAIRGASVF
jgi:hypothetical protein